MPGRGEDQRASSATGPAGRLAATSSPGAARLDGAKAAAALVLFPRPQPRRRARRSVTDPAPRPRRQRTPEALRGFLLRVPGDTAAAGGPARSWSASRLERRVPSIRWRSWSRSLSPGERHFYVERPAEGLAVAGAETALLASRPRAPGRFAACQRFIDETLGAHHGGRATRSCPSPGPHFFTAFTFLTSARRRRAVRGGPSLFVPRWQVAQRDGRTIGRGQSRRRRGDAGRGARGEGLAGSCASSARSTYAAPESAGRTSPPSRSPRSGGAGCLRDSGRTAPSSASAGGRFREDRARPGQGCHARPRRSTRCGC